MGWWVHDYYQAGQIVLLLSWAFWVLFSITMHELAHGWAAIWQGDNTPRLYNRMTMNPIVHMGGLSLLVFLLIGIAWGVMPTDPSRYRWGRRGRIIVSGAGPAMNILLAFIALTAAALWGRYGPQSGNLADNLGIFLLAGGWLNLVLAVFNLMPAPPLDGASVLAGFSMTCYRWMHHPRAPMAGLIIIMIVFWTPIGGLFFDLARAISHAYVGLLAGLLP